MALTVKKVRDLRAAGAPGRHHDGGGLYLIVDSKTAAHWERRYQLHGKARHMGLGSAGAYTLDEARERSRRVSQQLTDGVDPLAAKRAQQAANAAAAAVKIVTFKEAADGYIADNQASWKSAVHGQQWISSLATYVHPIIGKLDVGKIATPDVLAVLEQTVAANSKAPAGKFWPSRPTTADRVRNRIELVLNLAVARGYRPAGVNPASLDIIKHVLPKPAKIAAAEPHAALPYQQMPELMAVLRGREGVAVQALQFVILTAARAGEALGATWDEIDFDSATWTVPAERMKGGKQHAVPLPPAALKLLRSLYREDGNPFLFIGLNRKNLSPGAMATMLDRVGYGHVTVHGFRASFRTWAAERTSFPNEVAELSLAHAVDDATVKSYKRTSLLHRRRQLMARWAEFVTAAPKVKSDKVVSLRKRA
jgi:integrase